MKILVCDNTLPCGHPQCSNCCLLCSLEPGNENICLVNFRDATPQCSQCQLRITECSEEEETLNFHPRGITKKRTSIFPKLTLSKSYCWNLHDGECPSRKIVLIWGETASRSSLGNALVTLDAMMEGWLVSLHAHLVKTISFLFLCSSIYPTHPSACVFKMKLHQAICTDLHAWKLAERFRQAVWMHFAPLNTQEGESFCKPNPCQVHCQADTCFDEMPETSLTSKRAATYQQQKKKANFFVRV